MLQSISWKQYLEAVLILTAIWYLVVGFIYYRKEAKAFIKNGPKLPGRKAAAAEEISPEDQFEEDPEAAFTELENIVTDIRHSILEVAGKSANKDKLLRQLQSRLAYYDGLHLPAFRLAINNFIIKNGEEICGLTFSEAELNTAWDELPG
ncbi:hypothetical protein [Taibaiella koreensis]|uniref:hypothetical protein n=1 Tax=Taibaiella koreensis TaxID=1268548 RepID=UPI0013C2AD01|nr:hypothetical protein [Taibaiella koreensis]